MCRLSARVRLTCQPMHNLGRHASLGVPSLGEALLVLLPATCLLLTIFGEIMFKIDDNEKKIPHNKKELYEKEVELLKTFLEHGAITQAQYEKSFRDLTEKMGIA